MNHSSTTSVATTGASRAAGRRKAPSPTVKFEPVFGNGRLDPQDFEAAAKLMRSNPDLVTEVFTRLAANRQFVDLAAYQEFLKKAMKEFVDLSDDAEPRT